MTLRSLQDFFSVPKFLSLQMIFASADGSPLLFTLTIGPEKQRLRRLIETNGGQVYINNIRSSQTNISPSQTYALPIIQLIHPI
jgi:hypothetical protein